MQLGRGGSLGRGAKGGRVQWDPLTYFGSSLVGWFDMQDSSAFAGTLGGFLTSITNKASGVVWNTASTVMPGYYANWNGGSLPCMTFNGTTQGVRSTEAAVVSAMANNNASTVFVVCQANIADDATAAWGVGNSGVSSSRTKRYGLNTGGAGQVAIITVDDAGTGVNLLNTGSTSNTNANVLEFWSTTSVGSIMTNGVAQGATGAAFAPSTLTPDRCAIGCRPDSAPDQFWNGSIAEVLVFSRDLTAFERGLVRIYLTGKWLGIETTPLSIITSVSVTQWIRADQGITLATGVSGWNDLSGNNHHFAQGTTAAQPLYTAVDSTLNNQPTVTGDGSNDTLTNATMTNGPGAWQSGIVKMVTWGNFKVCWGGPSGGASNDANDFLSQGTTPQLSMYAGTSTNFSTGLAVGQWGRAEMHWNGASSYLKLRTTTVSGGNPGSNSSTGCCLFTSIGIGFGNYAIAERVVCSGKPTAEEVATVDAYYYLRYGSTLGI